jgi:hypothetical protein
LNCFKDFRGKIAPKIMAIMAGFIPYKKVGLQVVAVVFIKPSKDPVISTAGTMKQKPDN